ncbi:MAG: hypothetical protein OXN89_20235 [Bryobacterales bacterium]|nr:hypothetical protein [Bryobacterales bacterium]
MDKRDPGHLTWADRMRAEGYAQGYADGLAEMLAESAGRNGSNRLARGLQPSPRAGSAPAASGRQFNGADGSPRTHSWVRIGQWLVADDGGEAVVARLRQP